MRYWGFAEQARRIDQTPVDYRTDREWFTLEVKPKSAGRPVSNRDPESVERPFYLTFVVFEPGEYLIGSPAGEPDHHSYEAQHRVRVSRRFAILDREITRAESFAFGLSFSGNERTSRTPDHPMGGPSWYDAVHFCRWLSEQRGLTEEGQAYPDAKSLDPAKYPADPHPDAQGAPRNWPVRLDRPGFRLPTETEWEIACRGGTLTAYGFGRDARLLDRYGWFDDNSGQQNQLPRTLRPNARGLFDMHGNVWEWCHDCYDAYTESTDGDPTGPSQGSIRGGGWSHPSRYCRSAHRYWMDPALRLHSVGIRLAIVPSAGSQ